MFVAERVEKWVGESNAFCNVSISPFVRWFAESGFTNEHVHVGLIYTDIFIETYKEN